LVNVLERILYYPILREGIKVKRLSKVIKEFGLYLLLFILVSAVAVSEGINGEFTETITIFGNDSIGTGNDYKGPNGETSEISITIVETSSSEDVDDTDTGDTDTSDTDTGDTDTGDANTGDTNTGEITDPEDNNANDNQDTGIMPPNSNSDELTHEEWGIDEWLEWVLSTANGEGITLPPLPPVEDTIDITATGDLQ
jgi:hypothetical protein